MPSEAEGGSSCNYNLDLLTTGEGASTLLNK